MSTQRPRRSRTLAGLLTAGAVLWTAVVLAAPLSIQSSSPGKAAAGLALPVYAAGSLICHQRPERSFHLGEAQPVCARCFGLYVAAAIGALAAWLGAAAPARHSRSLLIAASVPTLATVALEWLDLAAPGNAVRFVAALPLGAAAGWVIVRLLRAEHEARAVHPYAL